MDGSPSDNKCVLLFYFRFRFLTQVHVHAFVRIANCAPLSYQKSDLIYVFVLPKLLGPAQKWQEMTGVWWTPFAWTTDELMLATSISVHFPSSCYCDHQLVQGSHKITWYFDLTQEGVEVWWASFSRRKSVLHAAVTDNRRSVPWEVADRTSLWRQGRGTWGVSVAVAFGLLHWKHLGNG